MKVVNLDYLRQATPENTGQSFSTFEHPDALMVAAAGARTPDDAHKEKNMLDAVKLGMTKMDNLRGMFQNKARRGFAVPIGSLAFHFYDATSLRFIFSEQKVPLSDELRAAQAQDQVQIERIAGWAMTAVTKPEEFKASDEFDEASCALRGLLGAFDLLPNGVHVLGANLRTFPDGHRVPDYYLPLSKAEAESVVETAVVSWDVASYTAALKAETHIAYESALMLMNQGDRE